MSTYNMTDKELIELAAKAAGYSTAYYFDGEFMGADRYEFWEGPHGWNPLTSDGDALRLAIELNLSIIQDTDDEVCAVHWTDINGTHVAWKDSKYAATRSAIVRAAAEIGKTL